MLLHYCVQALQDMIRSSKMGGDAILAAHQR
jgi:hypothetical protein